jgi:hypothetical protein
MSEQPQSVGNTLGKLMAEILGRTITQGDFTDPQAATMRAKTYTGTVYAALLGAGELREVEVEADGERDTYKVRRASGVMVNGIHRPEVAAVGFAFRTGTLVTLDVNGNWIRRSSTVRELMVAVL